MGLFSRKNRQAETAVIERRPESLEADRLAADGQFFEAIDLLTEANRNQRDPQVERELRTMRHLAGIELIENAPKDPQYPAPGATVPARGEQSLCPEATPDELTPELLRAAFLEAGCLLVRDVMDDEKALQVAADIDHSFEVRDKLSEGESDPDGFYDEMAPEEPFRIPEREWVEEGGGVLAADSPKMLFDMLDTFEKANLRTVIETYLGEKPAISAQKCTLRKATPDVAGGWHQDGKFMGDVRSMNVWLSLSRCGDVAPSMDVVPVRLEEYAEIGGPGTYLDFQISDQTADKLAGDVGVVRPIFNPGDALLFDHLFLHKTGSDPSMPNPRYAIESWFFGPSQYPDNYVPIAF
ncbi:MAG: hypothetical protein IPK93_03865 [Solirubrobacterales bacterium]|nr:hypothetical protein [Solirubrobacterales bacterium]